VVYRQRGCGAAPDGRWPGLVERRPAARITSQGVMDATTTRATPRTIPPPLEPCPLSAPRPPIAALLRYQPGLGMALFMGEYWAEF
jgi:hypothetical protein